MRWFILVVTIFLAWPHPAAAGRGWFQRRPRTHRWIIQAHPTAPRTSPRLSPRDQQLRALYPKYYGGFHARDFQNLGIPSGDIGIRGNGIYLSPW